MKNLHTKLLWVLCCTWTLAATAAPQQSHSAIRDLALAYAQAQTQTLPGKVSIKVEDIDPRTALPACAALEAFMPNGAQMLGKTSIGVRCNEKPGWSIFVQASIKISLDLLVVNKPLAQGTVLSAADFSLQQGELGQPGILTDPSQAIGKTLKFSIGAGQVLRLDMLRAAFVIRQGQTVKLQVRGSGYVIGTEGQALNDAAGGQAVRIRMASGQVLNAIATTEGSAEVSQ
jgi:flagella basal body P-ring formation protein FlgA